MIKLAHKCLRIKCRYHYIDWQVFECFMMLHNVLRVFHDILLVVHNILLVVHALLVVHDVLRVFHDVSNVLQVFHDVLRCLVSCATIGIAALATAWLQIISGIATMPQGLAITPQRSTMTRQKIQKSVITPHGSAILPLQK